MSCELIFLAWMLPVVCAMQSKATPQARLFHPRLESNCLQFLAALPCFSRNSESGPYLIICLGIEYSSKV